MPQHVQLLLVVRHSLKQLTVGRLPREELLNDLLHIGEASLRPYLLKRLLYFRRARHLLVHLRLKEGAPELLRQKVLIHFELVRVFIVVGRLIADLLLPRVSLDSALERGLFVVEGLEDAGEPILPLEVILVDQPHQLLEPVLRLQSLLLGVPIPLRFFHVYCLFVFIAVLGLVEADLDGNEVGVHAMDHVLSLPFDHFGLIMLIFYGLESVQGLVQP